VPRAMVKEMCRSRREIRYSVKMQLKRTPCSCTKKKHSLTRLMVHAGSSSSLSRRVPSRRRLRRACFAGAGLAWLDMCRYRSFARFAGTMIDTGSPGEEGHGPVFSHAVAPADRQPPAYLPPLAEPTLLPPQGRLEAFRPPPQSPHRRQNKHGESARFTASMGPERRGKPKINHKRRQAKYPVDGPAYGRSSCPASDHPGSTPSALPKMQAADRVLGTTWPA
jgi:hypothetical protein